MVLSPYKFDSSAYNRTITVMTTEKIKTDHNRDKRLGTKAAIVAGGLLTAVTITGTAYVAGAVSGGQEQVMLDKENADSARRAGDMRLARNLDERAARTEAWLDDFPASVTETVEFVAGLPTNSSGSPQIALAGLVMLVGTGYGAAVHNRGHAHISGAHI